MQPFRLAQQKGPKPPGSVDRLQALALLGQVLVEVFDQLLVLFLYLAVKFLLVGHKGFQVVRS